MAGMLLHPALIPPLVPNHWSPSDEQTAQTASEDAIRPRNVLMHTHTHTHTHTHILLMNVLVCNHILLMNFCMAASTGGNPLPFGKKIKNKK